MTRGIGRQAQAEIGPPACACLVLEHVMRKGSAPVEVDN